MQALFFWKFYFIGQNIMLYIYYEENGWGDFFKSNHIILQFWLVL